MDFYIIFIFIILNISFINWNCLLFEDVTCQIIARDVPNGFNVFKTRFKKTSLNGTELGSQIRK